MYRTETLYSCCTHHKVPWHVLRDISMARQCALGPLHPNGQVRVPLLQEMLFPLDGNSVGVSEYGHFTAQAQESLSDSGAINKAFFMLGS